MGDVAARLFLAIPLNGHARDDIARLLDERAGRLPGRVVRPANWHLTLRFLGDVVPVTGDRIAAALDAADLGKEFDLSFGGLGAFPHARSATVLWIGVDRGAERAAALAESVEAAVANAGMPPEDRPFRAHLTLSRIRPQQDVTALLERVAPLRVRLTVKRVVLYRSHLGRGGARYEEVEEFLLA